MIYKRIYLIFFAMACVVLDLQSQTNANFIFDTSEGCGSLAVNFIDQSTSTESIVDWKWDLGGQTSYKQNPGIIFTKAGTYTICLIVTTLSGVKDTICKENIIKVYEEPKADFTSNILEGCVPLEVQFDDISTTNNGKIVSWIWDIGGSANLVSTTDENLAIKTTYSTAGSYSSSLTIVDEKGCKSIISKPNQILVQTLPKFTLDKQLIQSCVLPWEIKLNNLDPDTDTKYTWDFGNGSQYTGANPPNILYDEAKAYTITVWMEKGTCKDSITFMDFVNVNRITDYEIVSESICIDQKIKLKDVSNYIADSVLWDFGDGLISKEFNPEVTFSEPGCYPIILTRYFSGCSQTVSKPCIEIRPKSILEYTTENAFSCLLPSIVTLGASSDSNGTYAWSIEGNNIDTSLIGANHQITIDQFGLYAVTLTFKNEFGCTQTINDIEIDITKFEANLPFRGPSGCAPYDAMLSDSIFSAFPIVRWEWQIGNPIIFTSQLRNPVFSVTDTGSWDLKLIVTNIYGCKDTIERKNYIKGGKVPNIDFTADPEKACLNVPRQFTNLSDSFADQYMWILNSETFSTEKDPEYTFPDFGVFDITLEAFHNGCGNTFTRKEYITVYKPKSEFTVTYNCDTPYTIDILNKTRAADSLYWVVTLSDTKTDTIRDSLLNTYTFPDRGLYFLSHYAKNFESGCEHVVTDSIFIVDLSASYTLDTIRGCAPLAVQIKSQVKDAVSTVFLPGQYTVINADSSDATIIFDEGGILEGPYLVVTDRHGCLDTFQAITPVEVSKINGKIDALDVVCTPGQLKLTDASTYGLAALKSKTWYYSGLDTLTNQDSPIFDIHTAGNYYAELYLEDNWGCTDTVRKNILAVPLSPEFTSDTLSCTSKAIRYIVETDGTNINTYEWDFGDGVLSSEKNPLHIYTNEGIYTVCVEMFETRGCSKQICKDNKVVIKNPIADFSGSPTSAPCPPLLSNFVNISSNANQFTWDFGDNSGVSYNTTPSHVYTIPGSFDVILIAELIPGCADTIIKNDFIQLLGPKADLDFNLTGNCVPLTIELSAQADKLYTFTWDYGNGQINAVPVPTMAESTTYAYDLPGSYVPKLLVADEFGCTRTFTIDPIIVNNIFPNFKTDSIPLCGLPQIINIENLTTGTNPEIKYDWTILGSSIYKSIEKNPSITIDKYGLYSAQLIASTINCIDTISKDSIIEIVPNPLPSFTIDDTKICQNTNLAITNNSTLESGDITSTYWYIDGIPYSNEVEPNINFTEAGTYRISLSLTTDKNCKDSTYKVITILPNTILVDQDDKTICLGDSINMANQVVSNVPFTSYWAVGNNKICDDCVLINVKPADTTTYFFYTLAENGCQNIDTATVNVVPIAGPKLELSKDTIVCNGRSIEVEIVNFSSQYTYEWDTKDQGLDCYSNCNKVNATPNDDTYYSVVVSNEFGCIKEDSILIKVEKSIPDFLINTKTICENSNTELYINGNYPYQWTTDPTLSCTTCSKPIASPIQPKYYYVSVQSQLGCTYGDSIFVDILPRESIDAGPNQTICKGETLILNGQGAGEINWSSTENVDEPTQLTATSLPMSSARYYLKSKVDECILVDSLDVIVLTKVDIQAQGDALCPGNQANLSVLGNANVYKWYQGTKEVHQGILYSFIPEATSDYTIIGSRATCLPDTTTISVVVYPPIEYMLANQDPKIYINSKHQIVADYDANASYTYEWSPTQGLSCTDCPQPIIQNIVEGTLYTVTVTDDYGCTLEDQLNARFIDECTQGGFYIPNIFSPHNNDGKNDLFRVYAEDAAEFISISIYDRWGEKVYASTDLNGTWDGIFGGKKLTSGVYAYIISAKCDKTNEIFNFTGDITILE